MSVTIYKDTNYNGVYAHINPGFYTGNQIRGYTNQSAYEYGEYLDNEISSIRVQSGTIAVLYGDYSKSASSSGARTIIGPRNISDLSSIGMNDKISSIQVINYRKYDSGPVRKGNVILYSGYNQEGRRAILRRGDYNKSRLQSTEVGNWGTNARSMVIDSNIIAIIYSGNNFDDDKNSIAIVGPNITSDLGRLGMIDAVNSIRIYYTDPGIISGPSSHIGSTTGSNSYAPTIPRPYYPSDTKSPNPTTGSMYDALYQATKSDTQLNTPLDVQKPEQKKYQSSSSITSLILSIAFILIIFLVIIFGVVPVLNVDPAGSTHVSDPAGSATASASLTV